MAMAAVNKVAAAIEQAYKSSKTIEDFKAAGFELASMPPKEYAEFVAAERVKWGKVIKEANVKLQ